MWRMTDMRYEQKLKEELALLEKELASVGRRNPSNPSDWEARPEAGDAGADPNELADKFESLAQDEGIVGALEVRYNNLKRALEKIPAGTFGICEVCGKKIEEDRLNANLGARTCIAHLSEEEKLAS